MWFIGFVWLFSSACHYVRCKTPKLDGLFCPKPHQRFWANTKIGRSLKRKGDRVNPDNLGEERKILPFTFRIIWVSSASSHPHFSCSDDRRGVKLSVSSVFLSLSVCQLLSFNPLIHSKHFQPLHLTLGVLSPPREGHGFQLMDGKKTAGRAKNQPMENQCPQ